MRRSLGLVVLLAVACSGDGGGDPAGSGGTPSGGGSSTLAGAGPASGGAGRTNSSNGGADTRGVAGTTVAPPSGGASALGETSGGASIGGAASGGTPSSGGTSGPAPHEPGTPGAGGGDGGLLGRGPGRGGSSTGGRASSGAASGASSTGTAGVGGGASGGTSGTGAGCAGRVTYTLARAGSPTAQQSMAYARITAAMDRAVQIYNCNTTIQKTLNVTYNPDVATADGNPNGSIRFGSMDSMNYITATHEISHTVGIGGPEMDRVVMDGIFPGANATAQLREITGDPMAVVHADNQHFWPYGLNYTTEVKSDADLVNHCKMVVAIRKDLGL
jgi:hypothetical protein